MSGKNPKVSICIPNYNYDEFVGQAIESTLSQEYSDFEIIVIDDASTDNSVREIKRFSDKRIKLYQNEKNIGRIQNINKSLLLASGDYLTILPSDGMLAQGSLKSRVNLLETNSKVGLVYSQYGKIDESGKIIKSYYQNYEGYIHDGEEEFKKLVLNNYIPVLSAMLRRQCFVSLGGFNEAVTGCADYEMWLRICLHGYDIAFVPEVLVFDRRHAGNVSNYHRQTNIKGMAKYRTIKYIFSGLSQEQAHLNYLEAQALKSLARYLITVAGFNLAHDDYVLSRKNLGLAVAVDDGVLKDWKVHVLFLASYMGFIIISLKKIIPEAVKSSIYKLGKRIIR